MAILDDAKLALRIKNTAFDAEIQDLIDAAIAQLKLDGVDNAKAVTTDPLIKRAVLVYVKANFGFDNPDAEKLMASFESIKTRLTLSTAHIPAVTP